MCAQEIDLTKRHRGDRRDGVYLGKTDPIHIFNPLLYPGRCNNEAYISVTVDLTNINEWLKRHNDELIAECGSEDSDDYFKYTIFHVVVAAMLKTLKLRPKMNRFIANKKTYQRRRLTASFVVKKKFSDNGEEALAVIEPKETENIVDIHDQIKAIVYKCRHESSDGSMKAMETVGKLPFPLIRFVAWSVSKLEQHGHCPEALISSDPYYCSVVLSNLGSIKLQCGYHHLTNWGTNSVFCIVGEKKMRPFFNDDGTYEMRDSLELGLTIDERLADGYYYSKTIRLLKKLLDNPELLELPLKEEVDY